VIVQLLILFGFAVGAVALAIAGVYEWIGKPWSAALRRDLTGAVETLRAELRAEIQAAFQTLHERRETPVAPPSAVHDQRIRRSRVQIEAEFAALQGVWTRLADVRTRFDELHSVLVDPPSNTPGARESVFRDRAATFQLSFRELETFIGAQELFLPESILQPLNRLLAIGRQEEAHLQAASTRGRSAEEIAAGMNRRSRFVELANQTGATVREYLSRVVVD